MKKNSLLLFVGFFLLSIPLMAQIPNAGFENWTNGNPDNWYVNNVPAMVSPITKVNTAHSGSAAAKGQVVQFLTALMSPLIQSGTSSQGFPISVRYAKISGFYQFNSVGGDRFALTYFLYKSGTLVGGGSEIFSSASSYKAFDVNLTYFSNDVPDDCVLQFIIAGPDTGNNIHSGSYYLIDDLSMSGIATSVESKKHLTDYALEQNYPNPFNPITKISYTIPKNGFVSLKVYDILGNIVSTLVNEEKPAGQYTAAFNGANFPSGFYIYELKSGSFSMTRKMMILK